MDRDEERIVRVVVRPYGSALPLGFLAFGIGMLVLAGIGLGWIEGADTATAGIVLASFVTPIELLAGAVAFLARDTAGAASLGLFSTSWLTLGIVLIQGPPGATSSAVGIYLVGFATMVVALATVAFAAKPLLGVLLVFAAARAVVSGIHELGAGGTGLQRADGVIAFTIFVFAAYGGLALLLEDARQRPVLPTGRIGAARAALHDDLADQLRRVEREAGVRQQL